jgi:hypothetical protein
LKCEEQLDYSSSTLTNVRQAMGGLWAYYRSSLGTVKGVEFWE